MKAGWIIALVVAAVAVGVYAFGPFGSNSATPGQGSSTSAGASTTGAATANAALDGGAGGQAALDRERARQPAALSGETRDPRRAQPEAGLGAAGDPPPLAEITGVISSSNSVDDTPAFMKTLEARYQRSDSAARVQALERLTRRYEDHLAGKTPEGEKGLDDVGLEQLQLEIEWLAQNPGS